MEYGEAIALGILIVGLFGWLKSDISRLYQGQSELRGHVAYPERLMEGIRDSITGHAA